VSAACRSAVRDLLPWYVNGSLESEEAGAVRTHLEGCTSCTAELDALGEIASLIRLHGVPIAARARSASFPAPVPSVAPRPARRLRLSLAGALAAVLVLIAMLGFFRLGNPPVPSARGAGSSASPGTPAATGVAVLPFTNVSPDKGQDYFSDGLTEDLLNALVKIRDLNVIGRTSSFKFKGKDEDDRTIGEKLGVANILLGSVRKSGDHVLIAVTLVQAVDGIRLWSETYDRTLGDIFSVQDDITRSVARALQVTWAGTKANATSSNAEAYDLVLQARYAMRLNTPEAMRQAREDLERALSLAPDDAAAWAEMGLLHIREQERALTAQEAQQALQRTREALTRALELDPDLAVAHSRMALVQRDSGDFAAAERSTERALAAEPNNSIVLGNASTLDSMLGKLDEAIALQEQARRADPLNAITHSSLVSLYVRAGRLDDAEATARKAVELGPDSPLAHQKLGTVLLVRGQAEAAGAEYRRVNELQGSGEHDRLYFEALVEHTAGHAEASRQAAEEFETRFAAEDPFYAAEIRAWRGESDAAFAWLDKARSIREPLMTQLKADLFLSPLHTDPRWNEILTQVGLPPG